MPVKADALLYLVRHGETAWNAEGRFQGRLDSPLTTRGEAQADAIGRELAGLGVAPDALHVSPLGRARRSAEIIASRLQCPPPVVDNRLAEVSLGSWDGLTSIDLDHLYADRMAGSTPFDWYFRSPDGESYDAVRSRILPWLEGLGGTVLAVSHGLLSRVIRGAYLDLPMEQALELPVPQDRIWKFSAGTVEAMTLSRANPNRCETQ